MEPCPSTSIPTFTIIRDDDLTLRFHPPHGSLALINALAIRYPLEPNLESQMRRALLEFISVETLNRPASKEPHRFSHDDNPILSNGDVTVAPEPLHTSSGNPELPNSKPRRQQAGRKSRYTPKKRRKVAEVRKLGACDYHREKKLEVYILFSFVTSLQPHTSQCNCLFQKIPDTTEYNNLDPSLPHAQVSNNSNESMSYSLRPKFAIQKDEYQGNEFPFYSFDHGMASSSGVQAGNFPQLSNSDLTYVPSATQPPTPSTWHSDPWN
ncbi:hypothetical protein BKA65DRAFT_2865 [Rhexocercosporidium sp. MPI-PUGE-AT-0058]|nr:hypothetical protein BKA65DRAFT_2865 [Rhexocercosporidium sp. MPI-PUGE-AT-0058]